MNEGEIQKKGQGHPPRIRSKERQKRSNWANNPLMPKRRRMTFLNSKNGGAARGGIRKRKVLTNGNREQRKRPKRKKGNQGGVESRLFSSSQIMDRELIRMKGRLGHSGASSLSKGGWLKSPRVSGSSKRCTIRVPRRRCFTGLEIIASL